MPQVRNVTVVAAPLERVYAAAQDIEGLAPYIADVESIAVTDRQTTPGGSVTTSAWVGLLPEFRRKLRWTERDVWDDAARTCTFEQLEGDFDAYSGRWSFTPEGAGTSVELVVDYVYEVPLIGPLIQRLVLKKVQDSVDKTQAGLKARAEQGG